MTAPALAPPAVALLEQAGCAVHYMAPYPDAASVAARVAATEADAILCRQGRVDGAVMDASPRLRIVARHGVGMDEVDLDAARLRGLLVTRAPGSNDVVDDLVEGEELLGDRRCCVRGSLRRPGTGCRSTRRARRGSP